MSTDASGFSLENAEKVLKPHLKYLPFKRLGDYMTNLDLKEKIRGKTFHLQLWELLCPREWSNRYVLNILG